MAAPLTCDELLPQMKQRHIPDVAVTFFSHGDKRSIFCTTKGKGLPPNAIFEAASLSKPVFAIGVLNLVKAHKIELDRPLSQYLVRTVMR